MKIKNLAFYGVMAAILGSVGTARADDSTIIASKGYVDAYAQKQADRVTSTWAATSADDKTSTAKYPSMATLNNALTTVEGNIQSVENNVLEAPSTDNPKLTKVSAIKAATTTSVSGSSTAVDTLLPTEKAVATALALKEDTANKLTAAADGATVTPWSASTASDSQYPTVKAVAEQISAANPESIETNALEATGADASKLTKASAIQAMADNTTDDYRTRNASNELTGSGSSTKVPTTAALVGALKDLDGLGADSSSGLSAGDMTNNQSRLDQPVVRVTQTDGQVKAELGQIGANGIKEHAITPAKVSFIATQGDYQKGWGDASVTVANDTTNNSNLGAGKASSDTYVPTMRAVEMYVGENAIAPNTAIDPSTINSIVTYDANGLVTGGIKLNESLNNINVANGGSAGDNACSAANPCVLSYIGGNTYKWTQMATEGLSAVADQASGS